MSEILIIVPCFNEAERLDTAAFHAFLESQQNVDLCFVNDGSTDDTKGVIENFVHEHPGRAQAMHLSDNVGKASAVREGMLACEKTGRYSFLGYWDADLATPLGEVKQFIAALISPPGEFCAIFGSRMQRLGAFIKRSTVRHILGRGFSTLASWVLQLAVYDSQCGAKLFKREVVGIAFGEPFLTRWLFDVEILARLRNAFGREAVEKGVLELPLNQWKEKAGSKLSARYLIRVPLDLLKIRDKYNS